MASNVINKKHRKSSEVLSMLPRKAQYDTHTGAEMADWKYVSKHNICAFLGNVTAKYEEFRGIIEFLRRSRIRYAISTQQACYLNHQREFWTNGFLDYLNDAPVIRSKIQGKDILITEDDIRRILHFPDSAEDPIRFEWKIQRGCFMRAKYSGPITDSLLNKAFLCPQFKYLLHVVIHCLGSRRGGFDVLRDTTCSATVALILNKPYNFSGMVFHHIKEFFDGTRHDRDKFLMYPRILQMIFDDQQPDLVKHQVETGPMVNMDMTTLSRLQSYRGKSEKEKPPFKRLFGHLANPDYVAPEDDKWRHDDSDLDDDAPVSEPASEKKRKGKEIADEPTTTQKKQKVTSVIFEAQFVESQKKLIDEETDEDGEEEEDVGAGSSRASVERLVTTDFNALLARQLERDPTYQPESTEMGIDIEDLMGLPTKSSPKSKRVKSVAKRETKRSKRQKDLESLLKMGSPTTKSTTTTTATTTISATTPAAKPTEGLKKKKKKSKTIQTEATTVTSSLAQQQPSSIRSSLKDLLASLGVAATFAAATSPVDLPQVVTVAQPALDLMQQQITKLLKAVEVQQKTIELQQAITARNEKEIKELKENENDLIVIMKKSKEKQDEMGLQIQELQKENAQLHLTNASNEQRIITVERDNQKMKEILERIVYDLHFGCDFKKLLGKRVEVLKT